MLDMQCTGIGPWDTGRLNITHVMDLHSNEPQVPHLRPFLDLTFDLMGYFPVLF